MPAFKITAWPMDSRFRGNDEYSERFCPPYSAALALSRGAGIGGAS